MTTAQYWHKHRQQQFHLNKRDKRQDFLARRTNVMPKTWDYELDDF